jgi:hypothetical protein
MTRRVVATVIALVVLAACSSGGGSDESAPTTTTTAGTGDEAAYIDAVYEGLIAETSRASADELRCVARAIVEGIGVDRLHEAGVTVAQVADADFEPPQSIADAMDAADRRAMGERLQACDIGRIVGADVSLQFASKKSPEGGPDSSEVACFGRGFEGPRARPMIAGLMLNDVSLADSVRLAQLTVDCIGLARLIANGTGVELSSGESACIERAGRTDTTFLRLLANEFRNIKSRAQNASARFGAKVVACLTPANRARLASGG